ncbi:glycosyltransferase family 2 protein [Blastococcus saxobsidens]|uniref:GT2 family glycosyltransferase n=1 Tax=Blastococcus saxobsidens TaxID=138336 RepID=A0A4Q7YD32_9ACTN|nr:glycosyltransferase family 2 protein [Blastococcus saxobsidens]RZU34453.1 GT2 family glycosyltransferase [Blastococcus saxobsidens]
MVEEDAGAATVIAVLTYRRTHLLPTLLADLVAQASTVVPRAGILVVDNDPDGDASEVVQRWAGRGVRYVHEPRPGISAARNRALAEAGQAAVLVFVDDDERPFPDWLRRLTDAWRDWGCAAVAGPVSSAVPESIDPWIAGSGVFDRPRKPTGSRVAGAGAGNLLLHLPTVRALGLRFDEQLGLTGGEDTLFTHALVRAGEEIRWCDEAEAVEPVPADRLTRRWVLRRCFRSGSSWSRAELVLSQGPAGRMRLRATVVARAAVRLIQAAGAWAVAVGTGRLRARGRAAATLASYAGLVTGAFGHVMGEYARVAGAPLPREAPALQDPTHA